MSTYKIILSAIFLQKKSTHLNSVFIA